MRSILWCLTLCAAAAAAEPARDLADVPFELRQENWGALGSCAHASTVTALRYYGLDAMATWWRKTYSGGEIVMELADKLDAAGIPYAYTKDGDVSLLDWAARNRQCVVMFHVPEGHAVNMVDFTATEAVFLDNNNVQQYTTMTREEFLRQWLAPPRIGFNPGWALVIVRPPPPPWPVQP